MRRPNWTQQEFIFLLNSPELSNKELSNLLSNRTEGAVSVVRNGVHSYHIDKFTENKRDLSMLSKIMKNYLNSKQVTILCPICKEKF
jgi:hypothetical protein